MYAVTADSEDPLTGRLTGVGGGQLRAARAAGLTAIVGDVSEAEFGEFTLRSNLEDLDWVERTARAHHAVIKAVAEQCPVVPMRLATVYASDRGVVQTLRQRAGDLRVALARITARSEWGVKAYAAEPTDLGPAPGRPAGDQASPAIGPGAAYLQRRRAQLTADKDARRSAMASAQAVYAELCRLAVSARLYPPQSPDLAGRRAPMVLNAAYLVPDERAGEFAAAVTDLGASARSVRLILTGPWPAYSFVGGNDAAIRDEGA
jgi:Gas vesicle synthesis protein GvpL/GvpF